MAAFIASQREQHGVPQAVSCRALGVSQSWFYKWKAGELAPRAARRGRLKAEVARLFAAREGKDGAPRITAALRDAGWRVSQNTVAGLMAEQGLAARPGRKGRRGTTRPARGRWRAPDLIGRQFRAAGIINRKWYGDGTEIATAQGKLYLDSVLDMGSRRILGHALGEHHDADLAYGALAMAVAVRGGAVSVTGVIFHSDQGAEYTAGQCGCSPRSRPRPRPALRSVECQDSMTALSSAEPGRPIDWRTPSRSIGDTSLLRGSLHGLRGTPPSRKCQDLT
ncbi:MAG: DDE-type integrase/transposase/recombinase [Streptosporangiaceae bacterium]